MSVTSELIEALRRHYIAAGEPSPGGVFAAEVGINGNWGKGRRCDALYAGFTSQSGRILIGHEVKVSRADWNHEREQLDKADEWADQCHAWYLVAPSMAIIPAAEVPAGWGLMVPDPRAKRRFKHVVKAHVHKERTPSWDSVRSMMARMDTLRAKEMQDVISDQVKKRVDELTKGLEARYSARDGREFGDLQKRLGLIEEGLGVKVVDWAHRPNEVTPEELVAAVKYIRAARDAAGWMGLEGLTRQVRETTKELGDLLRAAEALDATLKAEVPARERAS